jgi:hypothetical protein
MSAQDSQTMDPRHVLAVAQARRARGRALLTTIALVLALLIVPVAAQASFTWSAATPAGQDADQSLNSVSCPAQTQCTAVDTSGTEVTYNPVTGQKVSSDQISYPVGSESVSCPSATECVSAGITGTETVFNPEDPSDQYPVNFTREFVSDGLSSQDGFEAVSCPTSTQCSLLISPNYAQDPGSDQYMLTVPVSPPADPPATVPQGSLFVVNGTPTASLGLSCPSTGSCTLIGNGGSERTVDLTNGSFTTTYPLQSSGQFPDSVTCTSTTSCVAVDTNGLAASFDPQGSASSIVSQTIDGGRRLLSVACATTTICDAVDTAGRLVEFSTTASVAPQTIDLDGSQQLNSVDCPADDECSAVDTLGREVTADPTSGTASAPVSVDTGLPYLAALSCPGSNQCSAVGLLFGLRLDFNPSSPGVTQGNYIDQGQLTDAVSCPSTTECVAVDFEGGEITFTPGGAASPPVTIDSEHEPLGVACPSVSQCTLVDASGDEVTFAPGGSAGAPVQIDATSGAALDSVACVSPVQCTAVDNEAAQITFNPQTGAVQTSQVVGGAGAVFNSVACPSASQCTAVDTTGGEATFNPQSSTEFVLPETIDSGDSLAGIACPSTNDCVAVDNHGRAVEGDPNATLSSGSWAIEPIPGAGLLAAISCPASHECVTVDSAGLEARGTRPVPINTSVPGITGQLVSGQTLSETHGGWQNSPDAFAYQWARCDANGVNCVAIGGATGQTYTLSDADVGHTIAVAEVASNENGAGAAATSASTAIVEAPVTPGRPAVVSLKVSAITATSVTFSGAVVPDGLSTTATFSYGFDPKYYGEKGKPVRYTEQPPAVDAGSGYAAQTVSVTVSGLTPSALYHLRLKAANTDGDATRVGVSFTTAKAPPPGPPTLARTVNVNPSAGVVLVKPPKGMSLRAGGKKTTLTLFKGHGFTPLTQARQIPAGSQIDARRGTVRLASAVGKRHRLQIVTFGKGLFRTTQVKRGPDRGLTTAVLAEGAYKGAPSYKSCSASSTNTVSDPLALPRKRHPGAPGKTVLQTLTATDHGGMFATQGKYAAGTVRGTVWTTTDRCDGTIIAVRRGTVSVTDLTTRKVILVHAGQQYFARAPRSRP